MTEKIKTNSLSVYLIKEGCKKNKILKETLKEDDNFEYERVGKGDLYYKNSSPNPPEWVDDFFNSKFDNKKDEKDEKDSVPFKIFSSSASAAYIIKVKDRFFVVCFGYGYTFLKDNAYEERFGLKIVLNTIQSEKIRSIDKKNISDNPKLSREQIAKSSPIFDFGVDIEQDLIQSITGQVEDEDYQKTFGKTITGKDALRVSSKVNINNIKELLEKCYEQYELEHYKENFDWVDNISELKDSRKEDKLEKELIKKLKTDDISKISKIWLAIPEIIDWGESEKFSFGENNFSGDIDLEEFLGFLTNDEKDNLTKDFLEENKIDYISDSGNGPKKSWSVFKCLYCEIDEGEIDEGDQPYILNDGKWYKVENDFSNEIKEYFEKALEDSRDISLPHHNSDESEGKSGEWERKYNERIAESESNIDRMDRELIYHVGIKQQIEFCDLITTDKEIIHVKKYGASAKFSHFFNQGVVSGELFASDPEFREELNKELPDRHKLENPQDRPNTTEYEIVYAVISKPENSLDIPFFSKVTFRNAKKRLEGYGYKVSLIKIKSVPSKNKLPELIANNPS